MKFAYCGIMIAGYVFCVCFSWFAGSFFYAGLWPLGILCIMQALINLAAAEWAISKVDL